MILNDREVGERLIADRNIEEARAWWESGSWDKVGNRLLVDPMKKENLNVCSLDLSVGSEYVSLRDPYSVKKLKPSERLRIDPLDTVLILTEEYLGLPRDLTGVVVPRAKWIFGGTSINATRVDPSWYGKLIVGFNNLTKFPIELEYGEVFCTCLFLQTVEIGSPLSKKDAAVGRTHIERLDLGHLRQMTLLGPDQVGPGQMDDTVNTFGTPWDIVRGALYRTKQEIIVFIEKEKAPDIVRIATNEAVKSAYRSQTRLLYILIAGLLGAIFTVILQALRII